MDFKSSGSYARPDTGLLATNAHFYILPHQSIICRYSIFYHNVSGKNVGFDHTTEEGLKYLKYVPKPIIQFGILYECGESIKTNKFYRYDFHEEVSLEDIRIYSPNVKKIFSKEDKHAVHFKIDKNTVLPKLDFLKILSTDTFGYYVGPAENTLPQYDSITNFPIPAELGGYIKIKNTSSDTIKLCHFLAKNPGYTLLILDIGTQVEGVPNWLILPGCAVIIRYGRKINTRDYSDIPDFIARNPEFNGQLTFCTKKESIVIPLHIEFKEKDLRTCYGKF